MKRADEIENIIKKMSFKAGPQMDKDLWAETSKARNEFHKTLAPGQHNIWRMIMKTKTAKFPVMAIILIVVLLVGVYKFIGSTYKESVAWGEVLENINDAKSITWKSTSTEEGKSVTIKYMVLEPYLMRIEWPDGKIKIVDQREEKALLLDPVNMTATVFYAKQQGLDIYNSFLHFKDRPMSVRRISSREIGGKQAIGFDVEVPSYLQGSNRYYGVMDNNEPIIQLERVVWVNRVTLLPVLIEQTSVGAEGRTVHSSTDEIAFDVQLDESLFSLEVPPGYELKEDAKIYDQMKSASDMNEILKACMIYDNEHGQWPDSLEELVLSGIDVSKYIYLKPPAGQKRSIIPRLVLYDAYEVWQSGVNVGFTNGRVEFISSESDFQKLLKEK
jgi:outer membrane lipoprotein-sorting protein